MGKMSDKVKDVPKSPIKTYQWEDVRRAKKKGKYPWTHLHKPPLNFEINLDEYTIPNKKRNFSAKFAQEEIVPKMSDNSQNTEVVHIENNELEIDPIQRYEIDVPSSSTEGRSKSEEPKIKRKLSIESSRSSRSRISLPKFNIVDALKSSKIKLQVPKLLKRSKSDVSSARKTKSKEQKPQPQKKSETSKLSSIKDESPVYIHIPLKPPPGQTDEFSKFELDSESHNSNNVSLKDLKRASSSKKPSLFVVYHELKQAQAEEKRETKDNSDPNLQNENDFISSQSTDIDKSTENFENANQNQGDITKTDETIDNKEKSLNIAEEETKSSLKLSEEQVNIGEKPIKQELTKVEDSIHQTEILTEEHEESSADDNISQYLDKDDNEISEKSTNVSNDNLGNLDTEETNETQFQSNLITTLESQISETKEITTSKPINLGTRAKSEEPKRKRKSSIDSSYSRKSLSKLAFIKKLKNAATKINPSKLPKINNKSKQSKTPKIEKPLQSPKNVKVRTDISSDKPVYIHIPLKPPPGVTDEYSHLEENSTESKINVELLEKEQENEVPKSPDKNVQLIILTPPSDDEILDANIPDTPSESSVTFFDKVDELKILAKNAMDQIYSTTPKLSTVPEDDTLEGEKVKGVLKLQVSSKSFVEDKTNNVENLQNESTALEKTESSDQLPSLRPESLFVDEEDGLQLSDVAIALINEEMAKEFNILKEKTSDNMPSPVLKKKVSFKRKSTDNENDIVYEDVDLKKGNNEQQITELQVLETSQLIQETHSNLKSSAIDEESFKKEYNDWSTPIDHEYEPVIPPPDEVSISVSTKNTSTESPNVEIINAPQIQPITEMQIKPTTQPTTEETIPEQKPHIEKVTSTNTITEYSKKINDALHDQAGKLKDKWQHIKKSGIKLPSRPKWDNSKIKRPSFRKPNINIPKLPEKPFKKLPNVKFLRKSTSSNDSWHERQYSTESNVSNPPKKIFDFTTYPRIFNKSPKGKSKALSSKDNISHFATAPRNKKNQWINDEEESKTKDVITIPLHPEGYEPPDLSSHDRYNEDTDIGDGVEEESLEVDNNDLQLENEYLKRWDHGTFHQYADEQENQISNEFDNEKYNAENEATEIGEEMRTRKMYDEENSSDSLSERRQGVLEEIDSDEFFLRQKGISQEDIDVGKYLSSEIREAFRNPANALLQLESPDREYDLEISDQSEPICVSPKKKSLKKPKRKKTPHVSKEQISFSRDSELEENLSIDAPSRPKRKNKKHVRDLEKEIIPYQETVIVDLPSNYLNDQEQDAIIIHDDALYYENELQQMYENEHMQGIEQPDIHISDEELQDIQFVHEQEPIPPKRKQRSLKSLSTSEFNSNLESDEVSKTSQQLAKESFESEEYIIPTPEPPTKAPRRRSRTRSQPRNFQDEMQERENRNILTRQDSTQNISYCSTDSNIFGENTKDTIHKYQNTSIELEYPPKKVPRRRSRTRSQSFSYLHDNSIMFQNTMEPPKTPPRLRSRTRSVSKQRSISQDFNVSESDVALEIVEVIEIPCVAQICDTMGYAVIDKSQIKDPPLPPSRFSATPPARRRKHKKQLSSQFSTVPRTSNNNVPLRPIRNYSTLGTTKEKQPLTTDKENEYLREYMEIKEDEPSKRLQSGDIVKKMKGRPLPAPPRPPRKRKDIQRIPLSDISHEQNVLDNKLQEDTGKEQNVNVSEEFEKNCQNNFFLQNIESEIIPYNYEETVTQGVLIVEPFTQTSQSLTKEGIQIEDYNNADVIIIPVTREQSIEENHNVNTKTNQPVDSDDEAFSEIPEEFQKMKNPPEKERVNELETKKDSFTEKQTVESTHKSYDSSEKINVLKTKKLEVENLDVNKLRVNELLATKIVVSELDGVSLQVKEINSKSGNLEISGIEFPPQVIQKMLDELQKIGSAEVLNNLRESVSENKDRNENISHYENEDEKKTPTEKSEDSKIKFETYDTILKKENSEQVPVTALGELTATLVEHQNTEEYDPDFNIENNGEIFNDEGEKEIPIPPPRYDSQNSLLSDSAAEKNKIDTSKSDNIIPSKSIEGDKNKTDVEHSYQNSAPICPVRKSSLIITRKESLPEKNNESSLISKCDATETSTFRELPPRPPQPASEIDYVPSQPPPSFYELRNSHIVDIINENIPSPPRRKRHHKVIPKSSSDESIPQPRRHIRSPEPSIPQLTGQLARACATQTERAIQRLISYFSNNVLHNDDKKQDLHVMTIILLVLIAGLILLGTEERVTIHHHHWDYFNPPKDL